MSQPLLTAAMIVRDEEPYLNGCLTSLDGIVDELVVVDTGSVDRTVAIARAHRAIGVCELTLDHLGLHGDQTRKHERNLPLLEAQLAVEPGKAVHWLHLSRVLSGLGRMEESERALERAVTLASEIGNDDGGV